MQISEIAAAYRALNLEAAALLAELVKAPSFDQFGRIGRYLRDSLDLLVTSHERGLEFTLPPMHTERWNKKDLAGALLAGVRLRRLSIDPLTEQFAQAFTDAATIDAAKLLVQAHRAEERIRECN